MTGPRCANALGFSLHAPLKLIGKLAAIVPPPRFNLVRYQGIFSPASRFRSSLVPFYSGESEFTGHACCNAEKQGRDPQSKSLEKLSCNHPRNYSWAELMKRGYRNRRFKMRMRRADAHSLCHQSTRGDYEDTRLSWAAIGTPVQPPQ
jgi:hypothetical protein